MLATRDALLALIETTYRSFKTVYKGYPLVVRPENVFDDGTRKGGIAIAPQSDMSSGLSTGFDQAVLTLRIELYIDATKEAEVRNRGEENEVWLVETIEGIRDLVFDNTTLATNTLLSVKEHQAIIRYGDREGEVRVASFELTYQKRKAR